jgi:hypothetical protein
MRRVCSTNGDKRKAYRILVEKPEGKRSLGRPRLAIMQATLLARNSEKWPKKCFPRPVSEPVLQELPPRSLTVSN